MEPLRDDELNQLLRRWEAPAAPASLRARLPRQSRWGWLLTGSIRIPVPVAAAAAMLLAFSLMSGLRQSNPDADGTISFAEFRPVEELKPRIIRSGYEPN